jgi:hypothetical protein
MSIDDALGEDEDAPAVASCGLRTPTKIVADYETVIPCKLINFKSEARIIGFALMGKNHTSFFESTLHP